jgi:hypothetical protein
MAVMMFLPEREPIVISHSLLNRAQALYPRNGRRIAPIARRFRIGSMRLVLRVEISRSALEFVRIVAGATVDIARSCHAASRHESCL